MRPKSVKLFEVLYLVSLGIGLVNTSLGWENLTQKAGVGSLLSVLAGTFLITVVLVLLISRKGSNVARWVLVVMFALGAIPYITSLAGMFAQNPIIAFLAAVQVTLQVIALCLVFRPDTKPWFIKAEAGPASASGVEEMNWRSGLIRFSIVLTVLWTVASFYLMAGELSKVMMPFAFDPNYNEIYAGAWWAYVVVGFMYWAGGAALWWSFLYTGFWIAKRLRR